MSPLFAGHLELTQSLLYDVAAVRDMPIRSEQGIQLFRVPVGGMALEGDDWQVKHFLRTNLVNPGELPAPQKFQVRRVNVGFFQDDRLLRLHETPLYKRTLIDFSINGKWYWMSPAWCCATPFAWFDALPAEKLLAMLEWAELTGGLGKGGVWIGAGDQFLVSARVFGEVPRGIDLAVTLDGPLARAIQ